jgi:cytochrome c peroxidase
MNRARSNLMNRSWRPVLAFGLLVILAIDLQAEGRHFTRPRHRLRHTHQGLLHRNASNGAIPAEDFDPPENTIGERLFLETRLAQYFAGHYNGNVNQPLTQGDPTLDQVQTVQGTLPGPFAGQSMNCRSCHFVDEFADPSEAGNRTYADFAQRSPIPDRGDGRTTAPRNALNMVDSNIPRAVGLFLHGDGEFSRLATLVDSTMTGRNFGWRTTQYAQAVAHIAKVIREDDGSGELAQQYGGSYTKIFLGTAADIPNEFRLPAAYRLDVTTSTDRQMVDAVSNLIAAYVFSPTFSRDASGVHDGSPYDVFLAKNNLPAAPNPGESGFDYSQRLLQAVDQLQSPQYVSDDDSSFETHNQPFVFGALELQGLKVFLTQGGVSTASHSRRDRTLLLAASIPAVGFVFVGWAAARRRRYGILAAMLCGFLGCGLVACAGNPATAPQEFGSPGEPEASHAGNCIACHAPPDFSDFRFHNTGASQEEYDAVHGPGSFANLAVPEYDERQQHPDDYLPATPQHPSASGVFRSVPAAADPRLADLGLWNVYANTDFPEPQPQLQSLLCTGAGSCDPAQILPNTLGKFKTPVLRDLGHSQPYLHSGRMNTLEDVLNFYRQMSDLARAGRLRNTDAAISGVSLDSNDTAALAAFLRALNEDYD